MTRERPGSPEEGSRGFTLIEVLFSGFVLAVAVLGMMSLISVGHGMSRGAWEMTLAMNAAQDKLEEVKEQAELDFYLVQSAYAGELGEFDVARLSPPLEPGLPMGVVHIQESVAGEPDLVDVQVTVRWWGVGGNQDVRYRTRLSPH